MLAQSPVPTSSTCDSGQLSVQEMDAVFSYLPAALRAQFQSAHDSIMQQYENTWYFGIDWIPFNPACGTMYDIGRQADALTTQMQVASGQATTTGPATGSNQPLLASIFGNQSSLFIIGGLVLAYVLLKK